MNWLAMGNSRAAEKSTICRSFDLSHKSYPPEGWEGGRGRILGEIFFFPPHFLFLDHGFFLHLLTRNFAISALLPFLRCLVFASLVFLLIFVLFPVGLFPLRCFWPFLWSAVFCSVWSLVAFLSFSSCFALFRWPSACRSTRLPVFGNR